MVKYEIKKVFSKTMNKITLLILAAALLVTAFLAIGRVEYVDEEGISASGAAAARNLRTTKNQWAGDVTKDVLLEALRKNAEINASDEYLSGDYREKDKAYAKKQGFSDIRTLINEAFCELREYDYYRIDSVTSGEVGTLYERRITNLTEWLSSDEAKDRYSDEEKAFLISQYEQLDTPFYYEYADGWKALLEYAPTIIMLLVIIMSFPISGIFSNEFQLKADAIFFSARFGRNKAVAAKVGAGVLIISALYWGVMLLYSAIVLGVLGVDGAGCAIQTGLGSWKSFYNMTYGQEYLLMMAGGYVGSLFMLLLTMVVSAKTHSTVMAVTVPFILLFLPSFLNGISVLSGVLGLLPDQLLQINTAVCLFQLYQIGNWVTGAIPVLMVLYVILCGVLLPWMYQVYRKHY